MNDFFDFELSESYNKRICPNYINGLTHEDLKSSKALFNPLSIKKREPSPKALELFCILGGFPFNKKVIHYLEGFKQSISNILKDTLHYLVPDNQLAIELAIIKWQNQPFDEHKIILCEKFLSNYSYQPIIFKIQGFQFHNDGAIIARCFDKFGLFRSLRSSLLESVKVLPSKQSSWCHIPLGRILEEINTNKLNKLRELTLCSQKSFSPEFNLFDIKIVHEKKWYQSDSEILYTFKIE